MRRSTWRNTALHLTVTAVTATVALVAVPSAATAAGQRHDIAWAPCAEDPTAECGTLAVPVDWRHPDGPTIDLALARRRATDPGARQGSLVVNPGGPGGSGVDFVIYGADYFSPAVRSHFDLVGFDPRGVARSHPVVCALDLLLAAPSPLMGSQADFDAMVAYNRALAADCRQRTGPLFDHVDTLSVVHDLDAIRAAVGDRKLTYYGVSYGTLIGQQYAEVYGDRARALVIDSNMDHSLGTTAFLTTETAADEDSFDQFAAWCDRTAACALHGQGARAVYADLRARAERGDLVLYLQVDDQVVAVPLGPFDLPSLVFGAFYSPQWWELADVLAAMEAGVPVTLSQDAVAAAVAASGAATARGATGATALVRASVAQRTGRDVVGFAAGPVARAADRTDVGENPTAVFCEDWNLPIRDFAQFDRYLREMNRIAPDFGPSPIGLSTTAACLGWPGPVNNPQHRLKVRSGPTLFMTNSLHDPATGYAWALGTAAQLGRHAVLTTYEGWGHGVYGRTECTTAPADAYLMALRLPAPGSRCPAVEPPQPAAGSAGAAALVTGTAAGSAPLPSAPLPSAVRPSVTAG